MAVAVVAGASIMCTMGTSPGTLIATNQPTVLVGGKPIGTVADAAPFSNLVPCGMCTSMANPAVASATAAALGVLTPQPCTPTPAGVWICAGTPLIGGVPALNNTASLTCAFGGAVSITNPGQTVVAL